MMKRYYQGLSNEQLDDEIKTLNRQLADARDVRNTRTGIELFRCGECGKTDKDDDVIFNHLVDDHKYPDEDASYTIERIFA